MSRLNFLTAPQDLRGQWERSDRLTASGASLAVKLAERSDSEAKQALQLVINIILCFLGANLLLI